MKEKTKTNTDIKIETLIEPIVAKKGLILVDVSVTGGKDGRISVFIYNKDKDIDISELTDLNREIHPVLEETFYPDGDFSLEVSSPGTFRKIKTKKEFNIFIGRKVKIVLNDGKIIKGEIQGLENDDVVVADKDGRRSVALNDIKNAKLDG